MQRKLQYIVAVIFQFLVQSKVCFSCHVAFEESRDVHVQTTRLTSSLSNTTTNPNMESSDSTIIDLKSSFLRAQIFALSQPLQPSREWQDSVSEEDNTLRQRAIDEALFKLNTILKQHNKISYPPQAQRHVAEQIDQLYWAAGERDVNVNGEEWNEKGADYREFHRIYQSGRNGLMLINISIDRLVI